VKKPGGCTDSDSVSRVSHVSVVDMLGYPKVGPSSVFILNSDIVAEISFVYDNKVILAVMISKI
jgi:hypothetical protein